MFANIFYSLCLYVFIMKLATYQVDNFSLLEHDKFTGKTIPEYTEGQRDAMCKKLGGGKSYLADAKIYGSGHKDAWDQETVLLCRGSGGDTYYGKGQKGTDLYHYTGGYVDGILCLHADKNIPGPV